MKKNNDSEPIEVEIIEENKEQKQGQGRFNRFINNYKKVIIIGLVGILVLTGGGFAIEAINEWKEDQPINVEELKINEEEAKKIVMNDSQNGEIIELELDREDGKIVYEIKVREGNTIYEYELDANSGDIIEKEQK